MESEVLSIFFISPQQGSFHACLQKFFLAGHKVPLRQHYSPWDGKAHHGNHTNGILFAKVSHLSLFTWRGRSPALLPPHTKRMQRTPNRAFMPNCHHMTAIFIYIFILGPRFAAKWEELDGGARIPATAVKPVRSRKVAVSDTIIIWVSALKENLGLKMKKEAEKE